jgi:hypothetical protein
VNAGEKVISRAAELGRQGDTDGEQIWRDRKDAADRSAAELVAPGLTLSHDPARPLTAAHARATTVNEGICATSAQRESLARARCVNACARLAASCPAHSWLTVSEFRRAHLHNSGNSSSEIAESFS